MKTLFVSDLDGTLLQSSERTSPFTNEVINALVERGMLFSYATARSYMTAQKVTAGLHAKIPLIVYNGAMVIDNTDHSFLVKNFFGAEAERLLDDLGRSGVVPIVYAFIDGQERFSFVPAMCTHGMNLFLESRKGDIRTNGVDSPEKLRQGEIFYITCIDTPEKLRPLYEKYRERYHCVFQRDLYTKEQWLEIMPKAASKANAVRQLKERLGCQRVVAFGDGKNDIDMFEIADEGYAVCNAVEELKAVATGIIGSNEEDGVARWLLEHYREE